MTILYLLTTLNSLALKYPLMFLTLDLTLKSSVILVIACVVHLNLRNRPAADKSALWMVVITTLLFLPFLHNLVPSLPLALAIHETELATMILGELNAVAMTIGANGIDLNTAVNSLVFGYAAIGTLLALYLILGLIRVVILTRNATALPYGRAHDILQQLQVNNGISCQVELLQCAQCHSPVTWGVVKHKILLPPSHTLWNETLITQILSHELAHVQRRDWLCYVISRFAICLYWINPLIWIAHNKLVMESEKSCDDAAISDTGCSVSYAENLFRLANAMHANCNMSAPALFGSQSALSHRIRYILRSKENITYGDRSCLVSGIIVSILLLAPFSALNVSIQTVDITPAKHVAIPVNFISKDSVEYTQVMREIGGD